MPFSLRWQWELVCSDATPYEKLTGLVLRLFGDPDGANNAPAIRTLSAATGVAKSTVEIALAGGENAEGLEKRGFLDKTEGSGRRPNSYDLKVPRRTFDELAEALELRGVPTTGTQVNGSVPASGTQANSVVYRWPGQKRRSVPISERSVPPGGYDLERPCNSKKEEGTRLPENWQPSDEDRKYARGKGLADHQIAWLAEGFADYWRSGNAKGRGLKSDWPATWRTHVRNAIETGRLLKQAANGYRSSYAYRDDGMDRG
jgi:hypothetical protein